MSILYGLVLKNLKIYREAKEIGFDYLVNPETKELHRANASFFGPHNLAWANLENFIGITNAGVIEIHKLPDGTEIPIYDLFTNEYLGDYRLNKCRHCFPQN